MTAGERETVLEMDRLQDTHPDLEVWTGFNGTGRTWFARGRDGHPWLIASDDLEHFRAALTTGKQHQPA